MSENEPPSAHPQIKQEPPNLHPHIKQEPIQQQLTPTGQLTHAQRLQAAIREQQVRAAAQAALLASQGKGVGGINRLGGDDEQPVAFTSFNDGEETDSEISNIDDDTFDGGDISQLKNELVLEKETDSDVSMENFDAKITTKKS